MFHEIILLYIFCSSFMNTIEASEKDIDYETSLVCYDYSEEDPDFSALTQCPEGNSNFDLKACPPGFHKIFDTNYEYCYQISEASAWDYPCFKSGGASVITDFSGEEIKLLLNSLEQKNISRYYWLPAQRQKIFNPVVWYIPGPNWGRQLEYTNTVTTYTSLLKNCLVLDVEQRMITTDVCSKIYPSLCFYLNELQYPAMCPSGYHAFRYMFDVGECYGIEQSSARKGLTFNDFYEKNCAKPMGEGEDADNDLTRFVYKKIAALNGLSHEWCWFGALSKLYYSNHKSSLMFKSNSSSGLGHAVHQEFVAIININGSLAYTSASYSLPCMACQAKMTYAAKKTILSLSFDTIESKLYLTVYYPSALWKYDEQDNGIQCFSDAKGFVKVINVNFTPMEVINATLSWQDTSYNESDIERVVYSIDPVTDRSAQYWCEGHTKNFSLVTTNKIIVSPQGDKLHVFALVVKYHRSLADDGQDSENLLNFSSLIANIEAALQAEKALLMDILQYTLEDMLVLIHLHIKLCDEKADLTENIIATYDSLKLRAEQELLQHNITFVNISSSVYCLPTYSFDYTILNWELTEIGHTVSPKEFCLQDNGLPVTRKCDGSYVLGGIWSDVAGHCSNTFEPSNTTTFLYKFVKGQISENYTSSFLTDGLNFVLKDTDIIIPADIYYLAISLQHVLSIAEENCSLIDMGDIDNIAWVMDRILALDSESLRLAQSLNSTNVILDSSDEIMKILARISLSFDRKFGRSKYYLSVQPQFLVQISYPGSNNVSGIAISGESESDTFDNLLIQPLYKNSTLETVLSIENLIVATWLPEIVLATLKKNMNESLNMDFDKKEEIHIIASIYYNDAVFQQLDEFNSIINSKIIGLSVPGFITNLEHPIPLLFKEINTTNYTRSCGYWDFQAKKGGDTPGFWDDQGCSYVLSVDDVTLCECYHMTHFGQLLDFGDKKHPDREISKKHGRALNIITLVGSFLSLVGVVGIWLTAVVFQTWRKKAGTKVLLQLSTAIALPLIFIIIFNLDNHIFIKEKDKYYVSEDMRTVCIILGALLHYSIIASFVWMLITAVLQFIRYVRVLGVCRPSRFMIKFTLIGWGIPLLPVILVLAVDHSNYLPSTSSSEGPICYPSGFYFLVGVLLPVGLIILINVILFALVIYSISRGPDGKMRSTDMDLVGAQFRLSIFLFFLLGLTWIFGLISFSGNLLWSYLFCLTSTLQGFVLFIYFIICDPSTRKLWLTLMKPPLRGSPRDSITSLGISNS